MTSRKNKSKQYGIDLNLYRESRKLNWSVFASCLFICFAVAVIGSYFTAIDSWYYSVKPSITPPDYVFPFVWTILFYMISVALYYSWTNAKRKKKKVIFYFGINFLLNILWSFFYFKMKNPSVAFGIILLLLISIAHLILFNWKIEKKASYILIPYFIWVGFAAILNYLTILNL